MPIYELGYRHWEGTLHGPLFRWMAIARTGIRLAFRSKALRRLLIFAWTPLLYFGPLFFGIGYLTDPANVNVHNSGWYAMAGNFLGRDVAQRLVQDPESMRPAIWSIVFGYFFSYAQAILTMLVATIVGPPLISQDVKNKSFLVYFSKPITRWEYVLGKAGTLAFFIFLVNLLPALALYGLSVAFSPTLAVVAQTAGVPFQIVTASLVITIPVTLLILWLSSLTTDHRYASFGWTSICLVGIFVFNLMQNTPKFEKAEWPFLVSLYDTTAAVTRAVFDVEGHLREIGLVAETRSATNAVTHGRRHSTELALIALSALSFFSMAGLMRRISAPMRI